MASRPARPEDFDYVEGPFSMDHLLGEYDAWSQTLYRDTDEYDLISKTKALYAFVIKNYNEPGRELLLKAIAAFEAAENDSRT